LTSQLSILVIGDTHRAEFRETVDDLSRHGSVATVHSLADADLLLADQRQVVDLVVVLQAYPGEVSSSDIDRIRRQTPLARIVGLLGSWCEGEMRSGTPWPAVLRVYWYQWPARCAAELGRICCDQAAPWSLPVTATEEERLLVEAESRLPTGSGLVAVDSPSFEMADWLSAACRRQGFATVRLDGRHSPRVEGAAAALLDMADSGPADFDSLRRLVAKVKPAPVLPLVHFPRTQDLRRARECGAHTVLSKPVQLEDLFWHLDRLAGTSEAVDVG
jgi:hypothetical protein